jgi:hypothetical protein
LGYGSLDYYAHISSSELANQHGIKSSVLWGGWEPLSRVIFDQGLECNGNCRNLFLDSIAFAGFTVMLSAFTDSFTILGGNSLMPQKMLSYSK